MKKIFSMVLVAAVFVLPVVSSAATYHYIDLTGRVQTVEAVSAQAALAIAIAKGDILHSGVKIDEGILEEGDLYGVLYNYVDNGGRLKAIVAASVDAAFILATDRTPHSGFLIVGPAINI